MDLTSSTALDAFGVPNYGGTGGAGDSPFGSAPSFGGTPAGTATGMGGATPAATGTSGTGDFASRALGFAEKNPGMLLGAGALGLNMIMNSGTSTGETGVQKSAGEAGTIGRTLTAYQQSGTLPAGLQAVVDQQAAAGEAETRSRYAQMGLSGSTMEGQQLASLKQLKAAQVAQIADNLAKQGFSWSQLSAQEFDSLMKTQAAQDTAFTGALGKFAAGLAGAKFDTGGGTGGGTGV